MLKIVTCKWDAGIHPKKDMKFEPFHVEILFDMLKRYLNIPFEFICITDKPIELSYLRNDITILPMWSDGKDWPGCFRRLKIFSKEVGKQIGGRFVSMDLDVIITGNITNLFSRKEDFVIWGKRPMRNPYCGSLFMVNPGTRDYFWNRFNVKNYPANSAGRYPVGTDQWHIWSQAPEEATWSKADGVYNFGFDIRINDKIMERGKEYYFKAIQNPRTRGGDGKLPSDARIIFFNGKDDPSQPHLRERYPWIKEYWK